MLVTLIKKEKVYSVTLPEKIKGRYWISDDDNGEYRSLVSIEGISNKWYIKSNKKNYIVDGNNARLGEVVLDEQSFYKLITYDEEAYIFAEPNSESRQIYTKLVVEPECELSIGRGENNVIAYNNRFVSGNHATLVYYNGQWTITDNNSTNGTFVNDYRITTSSLNPGDVIFIMGLKIIVGGNYLAINNPDYAVTYNHNLLFDFPKQSKDVNYDLSEIEAENKYYYRSPRFKRMGKHKVIKIDPPPNAKETEQMPAIFVMGPAITMGLASMTTAAFSVMNAMESDKGIKGAIPSVVMALSMLLGMILWPTLSRRFENKRKQKAERIREIAYREYLQQVRDEILKETNEQQEILHENNVDISDCVERINYTKPNLWERSIRQDDFLELRVGLGTVPLDADIQCPERKFMVEMDHLQNELYAMVNEPKNLVNVPITFSLKEITVSGIVGEDIKVRNSFLKSLVLRISALHSYDEVKMVFLMDEHTYDSWDFVRWIPHVWDNDKNIRFIATNIGDARELSAYLEKVFFERADMKKDELKAPYYIIFNMSSSVSEKLDIVSCVLKQQENTGFSIVNVCDSIIQLPKECSMVIDIDGEHSRIYDKDDITGNQIVFKPDTADGIDLRKLAVKEANTMLDLSTQVFNLPNVYTFLEMFGVERIEHLNPLMRWKENNPCVSLAVPVGVDTMGETFTLDLHEKYQGPHGLVAGMTGSGKSEFIITYILSLAVNYHPDEVAFILIDYKGGGLTGAFEYKDKGIVLPHLAGTITNLDGTAVKRSLISIQSELRRRQFIFNEARKVSNEGTMDIYKYQKLYRNKVVTEPVPHLFIISDEFAELKSQQPEFMEQLISAARIGRSLGVHLILATQKPNGVVDDQIWSNTRFRVCLKVSDKADSNDMIKRPDAAELSNTGRFYLQVGFNELFAMGQSAWCGAPYDEKGSEQKNVQNKIQVIDNIGRVISEVKTPKKSNENASTKQIVAIVKYLSELAEEENISVRQLWLDPIPAIIWPEALIEKYSHPEDEQYVLNPVVGEYDDPFNQGQKILTMPMSSEGNAIIYGVAGAGKITFITTMMYELIRTKSPEYLNIYALDFGSETLKVFEKAPQVGGVVLSSEEERVINLFKMLKQEMDNRRKLFSEYGGDYQSYIKNSGNAIPNILVVINNYAAFSEMYDDCTDALALLTREGTKYGIYFVLAVTNANSVRYRIAQNFKQLYVLQLNDKTDYSVLLGSTDGTYPSKIKGRGLIKTDHTYEFQTAHIGANGNQRADIIAMCEEATAKSGGVSAHKIPVLPKKVDVEFLQDTKFGLENVPVGVDSKSLDVVGMNVANTFITFASAQSASDTVSFAQGIAEVISTLVVKAKVIDVESTFEADANRQYEYFNTDAEKFVVDMFYDVLERFKYYKANGTMGEYNNVVYIINSIANLRAKLTEDGLDKLKVAMDKGSEKYRINIVICDGYQAINKLASEDWYRNHVSDSCGVWIGDGVAEQYLLKIGKITSALYKEVESGFGFFINKGRYVVVKVLESKYSTKEAETDG